MRNTSFDFTGSAFVVTGASSGMGRKVARQLAADGATVLAIARTEAALAAFAAEQEGIVPFACDVCDKEHLQAGIERFVAAHGKLCGAVHAAGISVPTPLRRYDEEKARRVMDVNFWAGIRLVQLVNKKRYSNTGSSFVMFASSAAHTGAGGMFAYASAKAAVKNAVMSLAREICKNGNRINSVSPGCVRTEMVQKEMDAGLDYEAIEKRHLLGLGNPQDVSAMVLFLLTEEAHWITGTDFVVDGGYLLGDA